MNSTCLWTKKKLLECLMRKKERGVKWDGKDEQEIEKESKFQGMDKIK